MKNRWLVFSLVICVVAIVALNLRSSRPNEQSPQSDKNNSVQTAVESKPRTREFSDSRRANLESERQALEKRILALLASNNPADINKVYNELVPALVKMDPQAAADFSQSPEAAPWRSDMMMVVAQSWAKINTDGAQEWASHLANPPDNPTERDTMISYVSLAVADMDAKRAVQVLEQCPINKDRFEIMVESLAQQWADQDNLQPLVDLVGNMPASADRDGYFARIANAMARTDVVKAATVVSEDIAPGQTQADAAINVIRQWAWNDKNGARSWAESFPAGDVRDLALKEWAVVVAKRQGLN